MSEAEATPASTEAQAPAAAQEIIKAESITFDDSPAPPPPAAQDTDRRKSVTSKKSTQELQTKTKSVASVAADKPKSTHASRTTVNQLSDNKAAPGQEQPLEKKSTVHSTRSEKPAKQSNASLSTNKDARGSVNAKDTSKPTAPATEAKAAPTVGASGPAKTAPKESKLKTQATIAKPEPEAPKAKPAESTAPKDSKIKAKATVTKPEPAPAAKPQDQKPPLAPSKEKTPAPPASQPPATKAPRKQPTKPAPTKEEPKPAEDQKLPPVEAKPEDAKKKAKKEPVTLVSKEKAASISEHLATDPALPDELRDKTPAAKALPDIDKTYLWRQYQPLHPTCNKIIAWKWDQKNRQGHLERLQKCKPGIDNTPPRVFKHLQIRAKKQALEEERRLTVERSNKMLLRKMTSIMQGTSGISKPSASRHYHPSLNYPSRVRMLANINTENQQILARIEAKEPYYNHYQWFEERFRNLTYLTNIAAYPDRYLKLKDHYEKVYTKLVDEDVQLAPLSTIIPEKKKALPAIEDKKSKIGRETEGVETKPAAAAV